MTPSTRSPAGPLRMRLLLLAASGLLPLVIVLAWGIEHLMREQRTATERSALALSRALATAVDSEIRSIEALLDQMSTADELERADLRAFHLSARRNAQQLGWRQVVLADGDGHILLRTNDPIGTEPAPPTDPGSLDEVVRTRKPIVTGIVVSPNDHVATFAVRMPVVRGDRVVYILTAVLSTDVIGQVLLRQDIPSDTLAAVFDRSNRPLARSRPSSSPFASPSLQALMAGGASQGTGRTKTDAGEDLYTGYTRLAEPGWTVAVGTSVIRANQGLYPLLGAIALGLAGSLAIALLLAWMLASRVTEPIERLKLAAGALGRGDPVDVPDMDIAELDDVALALRRAASERDRVTQEREQARRAAVEANRSKDQFLAMLGHELRNPLAPIQNAVQLMGMKGDPSTVQERRVIERQLVHVTRLVDDLLDVSRITSGRLALARKPLAIAHVLRQVADSIGPSLFQRTLALDIGPAVDPAWVEGDEVRLVQVFNNLLVNAIKFTPTGGAIRMGARIEGEEVVVDVEDTGIGIASEELPRVFDLFYQSPQNPDRARGGLGLGLPIVRSLVEMHGGSVAAASAGVGQGTRMTVRLPLAESPEEPAAPEPAPLERGSGRVLVVDDNEDAADTCATLLGMSGYDVRVAYTPEAALEAQAAFQPQVAILDIGLPGMSGYELAIRMKRQGYGGRLAALTGYGQAADMAASKAVGFDAHLTKPVKPAELMDLLARLMAASSLRA